MLIRFIASQICNWRSFGFFTDAKQRVVRNSSPNQRLRTAEPNTHEPRQRQNQEEEEEEEEGLRFKGQNCQHWSQGNEANSRFQKTLKEKGIPPLRVAETGLAWLRQAAADDRRVRCQMVTRSAATGTKSLNSQQSSNDIRPETWDPQEPHQNRATWRVLCFRGVGPAGVGWHPRARPSRAGRVGWRVKGQISKGSWSSGHCPSGCSWDPAAEVEQQAGNHIMTFTPIGWELTGVQGSRCDAQRPWYYFNIGMCIKRWSYEEHPHSQIFNLRILNNSFDELYSQQTAC